MTDLKPIKHMIKGNPALYNELKKYFQNKLYTTLVKMVSCEDNVKLHFFRGIAHSYIMILNDIFEEGGHEKNTGVKV